MRKGDTFELPDGVIVRLDDSKLILQCKSRLIVLDNKGANVTNDLSQINPKTKEADKETHPFDNIGKSIITNPDITSVTVATDDGVKQKLFSPEGNPISEDDSPIGTMNLNPKGKYSTDEFLTPEGTKLNTPPTKDPNASNDGNNNNDNNGDNNDDGDGTDGDKGDNPDGNDKNTDGDGKLNNDGNGNNPDEGTGNNNDGGNKNDKGNDGNNDNTKPKNNVNKNGDANNNDKTNPGGLDNGLKTEESKDKPNSGPGKPISTTNTANAPGTNVDITNPQVKNINRVNDQTFDSLINDAGIPEKSKEKEKDSAGLGIPEKNDKNKIVEEKLSNNKEFDKEMINAM